MLTKLLFVDNDPLLTQQMTEEFNKEIQSQEYEILFTRSGEEALEIIQNDNEQEIKFLLTEKTLLHSQIDGLGLIKNLINKRRAIRTFLISESVDIEVYSSLINGLFLAFLTKPCNPSELKFLILEALKQPENINKKTPKVRFDTLTKLANNLPSKQKETLIRDLIKSLEQDELLALDGDMPDMIRQQIEVNAKNIRKKEELLQKVRSGKIDSNSPLELPQGHFIEEKYIRRDGKIFGPYYYLRWRGGGKLQTKYLGKIDPRKGR